ncbi:MAG: hypothetical protein PVH77_03375 [Phycisphaerales bacterium]
MNLYKDFHGNTQTVTPTDEEGRIIEEVKEEIFDANVGDELSMVEDLIQEWLPEAEGTVIEGFLKSLWNYFYAVKLIREERDYYKISSLTETAAKGFQGTGQQELASLAEAVKAHATAITELRKFNVHRAIEFFKSTAGYFKQAGIYSNSSQPIMDHMKTDLLFSAMMQASQMPDPNLAEILMKQASTASQKVAEQYYEAGTSEHSTYQGLAHFYKAIFALNRVLRDLNNFQYEKLIGNKELAEEAKQARALLKQGNVEDTNISNCLNICNAFIEISEVITMLSSLVLSAFKSSAKADPDTMQKLKDRVHLAISWASQAGPQGVMYIGLCEDLHKKIQNFELFTKQSKKNFIKCSLLSAAALLLPLFIGAFWANGTFNANIGNITLFSYSVAVALVAGLGYNALKFKKIRSFSHITNKQTKKRDSKKATLTDI